MWQPGCARCGESSRPVCNLYSVTKGQQAIREFVKATTDTTGNLPPLPGIFPDMLAPVVRNDLNEAGTRELTIRPEMGASFVEALPIKKFHGVGPATAARMKDLGIETGFDLKARSMSFLQAHFGKAGPYYYWIARGVDDRAVRSDRLRKSIGAENTFAIDVISFEAARKQLEPIIEKVWRYCEGHGMVGKAVTLKVKYADFKQITRGFTAPSPPQTHRALEKISLNLLEKVFPVPIGIRLLGISLSSLSIQADQENDQLTLGL